MNDNKAGLFKCFIYSITSFDKYRLFLRQSTGKAVGYLILFTLLLSIGLYVPTYFGVIGIIDEASVYITDKIPDFTLADGKLEINADMPIIIDSDDLPIIIDTTPGAEDRLINQYDSVILITGDKIIQKNYVNRQDIPLSLYQGITMTKDDLIDAIPLIKPFMIIGFIFAGIFFVIGKFISALVVSLIGLIANSSLKTNLSYRSIFKISIFSMTLPLIICTLLNILAINVPLLWVLFYIGSGVYAFGAINSIKKGLASAGGDGYGYYGSDTFNGTRYGNDSRNFDNGSSNPTDSKQEDNSSSHGDNGNNDADEGNTNDGPNDSNDNDNK
jgi:hypothetical protein